MAGIIVGARNATHVDDHKKIFEFSLDSGEAQSFVCGGQQCCAVLAWQGATVRGVSPRLFLSTPPLPYIPPHPAEDNERIAQVLAAGKQSTSDCYTWERGGKW